MKRRDVGVICLILIVVLGGFAFAYFNRILLFDQTKSKLESMGYTISNNVEGLDVSTFIQGDRVEVVPVSDLDFFLSLPQKPQINSTTIYEQGQSFYVFLHLPYIGTSAPYNYTAYQYTPCNYAWWIF
jgi:hypothetical protein